MLRISKLNAWYGASHALQDISLDVTKGEIVCLIGRNGAGKTTTLKSIMGLMGRTRGSVTFKGEELLNRPAHVRFALGLATFPKSGGSCRDCQCERICGLAWWHRGKRSARRN